MAKKELKPIQKELLRLFKEVVPLFEKNGIEYFACGGTMIGAVREKGFIPWDDDIDLFMTRPNYDKLMDIARKNNGKIGEFDVACGEINNSLLPFCKIFDKRYKLNAKGVEGDEDYLFLDIFPLDAVPDDENERKEFFDEIEKKRKIVAISRLTYKGLFDVTKNKIIFPVKAIIKFKNQLLGKDKKLLEEYLEFCKKYPFESGKCYWGNTWGKIFDVDVTKDDVKTLKKPFEDTKINVMKGYDKYLTAVFGDYMKRPEESEQDAHEIKIIKEEK
ncbi:LicD family protein [Candidatus Saccharibacteria bacterium]|nr:LicD family protein [Candidatus Saccharibacteria bacterium]